MNANDARTAEIVSQNIRSRKTVKVLAEHPVDIKHEVAQELDLVVRRAVSDAGWAPFHYKRNIDGIPEPWRAYLLWHRECRVIASRLAGWFDDIKPGNKMAGLLNGCGALVLVTWLPQSAKDSNPNEPLDAQKLIQVNEEHVAAASAMIQNLLLLLQSNGLGSYWSSGGLLRKSVAFEKLGINDSEKLLAAVFVDYFPETVSGERDVQLVSGKHRDNRSPMDLWAKEISI